MAEPDGVRAQQLKDPRHHSDRARPLQDRWGVDAGLTTISSNLLFSRVLAR